MMSKPILCIDFDGVIHSYSSGWQGADKISDLPVPGALEFLDKAIDHFQVMIFSSRSSHSDGIYAMRKWLRRYWLDAGLSGERECMIEWPVQKPAAFLTIDDRVVCFDGDWTKLNLQELLKFRPWNKK